MSDHIDFRPEPLMTYLQEKLGFNESPSFLKNKGTYGEQDRFVSCIQLYKPVFFSSLSSHTNKLIQRWPPFIDERATVPTGEWGIVKDPNYRFIQTKGVAFCVSVVLYDATTKTGLIAHFTINLETYREAAIGQMVHALNEKGVLTQNLKAYLIGGQSNISEGLASDLIGALQCNGIAIEGQDLFGGGPIARDVALDVTTGQVYVKTYH